MRAAVAANPAYPAILFVHLGTIEDGVAFFSDRYPEARAVADGNADLYRAFGLRQVTSSQAIKPGLLFCTVRAIAHGNLPGLPNADPLQMPGVFYVHGDRILWRHDYSHSGDSPNWSRLPAELQQTM